RTELVVLDELGYLALPEGAAELVFQVISERNERGLAGIRSARSGRLHWPHRGRLKWPHLASVDGWWVMMTYGVRPRGERGP
ncbi:MAG: ATP-binding protein, partial [Actinobacteria bacterium]|nr:ATP-binding protein [Actinomycetota bacterium]